MPPEPPNAQAAADPALQKARGAAGLMIHSLPDFLCKEVVARSENTPAQLKMKSNTRQIAYPRQIAMWESKTPSLPTSHIVAKRAKSIGKSG